jgi:hypothetical protein
MKEGSELGGGLCRVDPADSWPPRDRDGQVRASMKPADGRRRVGPTARNLLSQRREAGLPGVVVPGSHAGFHSRPTWRQRKDGSWTKEKEARRRGAVVDRARAPEPVQLLEQARTGLAAIFCPAAKNGSYGSVEMGRRVAVPMQTSTETTTGHPLMQIAKRKNSCDFLHDLHCAVRVGTADPECGRKAVTVVDLPAFLPRQVRGSVDRPYMPPWT